MGWITLSECCLVVSLTEVLSKTIKIINKQALWSDGDSLIFFKEFEKSVVVQRSMLLDIWNEHWNFSSLFRFKHHGWPQIPEHFLHFNVHDRKIVSFDLNTALTLIFLLLLQIKVHLNAFRYTIEMNSDLIWCAWLQSEMCDCRWPAEIMYSSILRTFCLLLNGFIFISRPLSYRFV